MDPEIGPPTESIRSDLSRKIQALTPEEVRTLLLALVRGQSKGFTKRDSETVVDWAKEVRINHEILTLTLKGELCVGIRPDGDVQFSTPERRS